MKIATVSAVCGSTACNASCPYCISKMTPSVDVDTKFDAPNWRNFRIGCKFAKQSNVSTILITGKGEPTLNPKWVSQYLATLNDLKNPFPFVELQTNGIRLLEDDGEKILYSWYRAGLTLASISIMHPDGQTNSQWMRPEGPEYNFWDLVDNLHKVGLAVRINWTLTKAGCRIDDRGLIDGFKQLVSSCLYHKVEQLTCRDVQRPNDISPHGKYAAKWVDENRFEYDINYSDNPGCEFLAKYINCVDDKPAKKLLELPHGATVYDYYGQNVCLSTCLTHSIDPNDVRQLIIFPDGSLRYSWEYEGARIL